MSKDLKKGRGKKGNENMNSIEKLNENKTKKKPIAIIDGEEEDLKEDKNEEEKNNINKTDNKWDKYRPNMRRVDKVKIMVRKGTGKEPKQKVDEDKSKKKDIKKEESVSSWSVESVEVIKENGVYKKEDKDLQDKIKKSLLKQKEKKKNKGENDDEDDENKDGDKNKDKDYVIINQYLWEWFLLNYNGGPEIQLDDNFIINKNNKSQSDIFIGDNSQINENVNNSNKNKEEFEEKELIKSYIDINEKMKKYRKDMDNSEEINKFKKLDNSKLTDVKVPKQKKIEDN